MLSIRVNTEKEAILPIVQTSKITYNTGMYLYQAMDNDLVLGTALFEIKEDQVSVLTYSCVPAETHFLMDGVIRAGFHYASEHGVTTGILPEQFRQEWDSFFKKLNYPNENEFNIDNFFTKYKNCAH